jgi:hypothetical protein
MKSKLFVLVFFFLCVVSLSQMLSENKVFAQYVDTAWVRRYNGPGDSTDQATAVAVDGSGNVYVTGRCFDSGTYDDYVTIKYYPNGDTAWMRRYDGPANKWDMANAMAIDRSNNVYVTGYSYDNLTFNDFATIKYYPTGDTVWLRRHNGPGLSQMAYGIGLDDSGNVYVTGVDASSGAPHPYWDFLTVKYYPNGDTGWVRIYNGHDDDRDWATDIAIDGSGNVYVTGWSDGTGTENYDYATIKYYPNGDTGWARRYNGPANGSDYPMAIVADSSGNIYVTGYSSGSNGYDYATIKYYPNGDTAWVRRYNGPENDNDQARDIAIDGSGNVYVTGYSWGGATQNDYATIKYDSTGNEVWVKRYNGIRDWYDAAYAIAVDGSGNVYVTGDDSYEGGTYDDYATIKYKPNGDTAWVRNYNGPGSFTDIPSDIVVDASGNVYVTGASVGSGSDFDYATIKYIQYDSIPFAPAVNYVTGINPQSVFCADLDGDVDLDLAVANATSDSISILKNNGDGTFQDATNYRVGDKPWSIFCADLDGDTDFDIAVVNASSDSVSILKNNGDGTFQSAVNFGVGRNPVSVFCADLDGDDDLDLAVANYNDNNVSILKNNEDGTFQTQETWPAGNAPYSVFCADLDGDADLDLAVANYDGDNVSILKNEGDGTFPTKVNYPAGNGPTTIFCADFDGDFDLDLAVTNILTPRNKVYILENNGGGAFPSADSFNVGSDPWSIFCADLDGDTDMDLVVTNSGSNNLSILKNNGDGSFQGAINYTGASAPHSVFCADLDMDTDLDLVIANYTSDSISILKNLTQTPANQPPWAFSLISPPDGDTTLAFDSLTFRWQAPYDPNFGDHIRYDLYVSTEPTFDPDFTVIHDSLPLSRFTDTLGENTYYWKVKAYDNWGAETWSSEAWSFTSHADSIPFAPAVHYEAGEVPISVFCADLDGDNDIDLAVANSSSNNISILKNNGDGTFYLDSSYAVGDVPHSVFCADLDGDGDLDLAVANVNWPDISYVSILKNNGDGTFQTKVDYPTGDVPLSVFCADLDGDADLDLAVTANLSDNVSILKNNGNGTFQAAVNYGAGSHPVSVFCADLDGDGDRDLALANQVYDSDSGNVSILKNNGDGTFQSAVSYVTVPYPTCVFCADLDGDNDLDLAAVSSNSYNVSLFKNNGDGTFQGAVNYGAGGGTRSVFCGDLDGDNDLDLVVTKYGTEQVSILKNNGDGTFQSAVDYGPGIGHGSIFCADLDGDGDIDLAVVNESVYDVSIFKNLTQVPANQPPWPFSLITPEDQDTIFGSTTFQWHIPYDPNFGDQMRYDLYISTSPGFEPLYTTIDSNLAVSKFATVVDSGTHYWKVKAKDNWGAERWSTETWSLVSRYLTDTLTIIAFSPVDLIVTDPIGDSIGIAFNTIPNADYDTTTDYDQDGDKDDIVTIPDRLVGNYLIEVVAEPGDTGVYDLGIRIDGTNLVLLTTDQPSPSPGEPDTFTYNAPWYVRGDANGDWKITASDVVYLINYLYIAGPAPEPLETGDVNCDGMINAADIVYLINYLYIGGPPPSC